MNYNDKVALVLALIVLAPLCWHLWRTRPAEAQAWRALMNYPHRPRVQWPARPYNWKEDGL